MTCFVAVLFATSAVSFLVGKGHGPWMLKSVLFPLRRLFKK